MAASLFRVVRRLVPVLVLTVSGGTFLSMAGTAHAAIPSEQVTLKGAYVVLDGEGAPGQPDTEIGTIQMKDGSSVELSHPLADVQSGTWVLVTGVSLPNGLVAPDDDGPHDGTTVSPDADHLLNANGDPVQNENAPITQDTTKNVLVINTTWPGGTNNLAPDEVKNLIDNDVSSWYQQASYNSLSSITADETPLYTIADPGSCDPFGMEAEAKAAAVAGGYDLSQYTNVMMILPDMAQNECSWAGLGAVGYKPDQFTWIYASAASDIRVPVHELGHNFGLYHSNAYICGDKIDSADPSDCHSAEYQNPFSAMGDSDSGGTGTFDASQLAQLGWLDFPVGRIDRLNNADQTLTLSPLENTDPGGDYQVVKYVTADRTYWIEYRQPTGLDSSLSMADGVYVSMSNQGFYDPTINNGQLPDESNPTPVQGPLLLDMHPGDDTPYDEVQMWNAGLGQGETYIDPFGQFSITVNSADSNGANITVSTADNQAPTAPVVTSPADNGYLNQWPGATLHWDPSTDVGSAGMLGYILTVGDRDSRFVPASQTSFRLDDQTYGETTWTIQAVDRFGNRSPLETYHFDLDNNPPILGSQLTPSNNVYLTDGQPTFTWEAPTDWTNQTYKVQSGVASQGLYIDDQLVATLGPNATSYTPAQRLSDGPHTWYISATDAAGNATNVAYTNPDPLEGGGTRSAEIIKRSFVVDTVAPTAGQLQTPADGALIASDTPLLQWSPGSDADGVDHYVLLVDGNPVATVAHAGFDYYAANTPSLGEGTHTWQVKTVDDAGLSSLSAVRTFTLDENPPTQPALQAPADGAVLSNPTPTLAWAASSDSQSGVAGYELQLDGHTTNVGNVTSFTPSSNLSDGVHSWTVYAVDNVGRTSAIQTSRQFRVDTTAPEAAQFNNTSGHWFTIRTIPVQWGSGDDFGGSGVDHYTLSIDGGPETTYAANVFGANVNVPDGNHTLTLTTYDVAGNHASSVYHVLVDATTPTISLDSPAQGATGVSATPTFTFTGADDAAGSGVFVYTLHLDSWNINWQGSPVNWPIPLGDGVHTWSISVQDAAGNITTSAPRTFTVGSGGGSTGQFGPPQLIQPADGSSTTSTQPVFSWNAVPHATEYDVTLDGHVVSTGSAAQYVPSQALNPGVHTWSVRAVDGPEENSAASTTASFTVVDILPPVILSPADGGFAAPGDSTLSWIPVLNAVSYEVSLDGNVIGDVETAYWTSDQSFAEGHHTWQVVAIDADGHRSTPTGGSFIVDTKVDSAATITSPSAGAVIATSTPTIHWSPATDSGSGINEYDVIVDNNDVTSTTATSVTLNSLTNGQHTVTIVAGDNAGNELASDPITFTVDTHGPTAGTLVAPANHGLRPTSAMPMFSWHASTCVAGLGHYALYIDGRQVGTTTSTAFTPVGRLADGAHTWLVKTVDNLGRTVSSATSAFVVDTTAPTAFSVTSPRTNAKVKGTHPRITWSASKDATSGIARYELLIDGKLNVTVPAATHSVATKTALKKGKHTVQVIAVDKAGHATRTKVIGFTTT